MSKILKIRRGTQTEVEAYPIPLSEIIHAYDTDEIYIGGNSGNVKITNDNSVKSIVVNVQYPPTGLTACKGDGVTDDTSALQAIVNYVETNGGTIFFPTGVYIISSTIMVEASGIVFKGTQRDGVIIKYTGSSGACFHFYTGRYNGINNMNIYCEATPVSSNTAIAVFVASSALFKAHDLYIFNFKFGIELDNSANGVYRDIVISQDGSVNSAISLYLLNACVSSYFYTIWCENSYNASSSGIIITGTDVADLNFIDCAVSGSLYGAYIDATNQVSSLPSTDIHFYNFVTDGIKDNSFYITNFKRPSALNIIGGWLNNIVAGVPNSAIKIDNCDGVNMIGIQFHTVSNLGYVENDYVTILNSRNCKVTNCTFIGGRQQINVSGTTGCVFSNNTAYNNDFDNKTLAFFVSGGTSPRNILQGNNIDGNYSFGISTTDDYTLIQGNIINPTNVTTPLTTGGTDSVSANNIIT